VLPASQPDCPRKLFPLSFENGFYPRRGKAGKGSHQCFQNRDGRRMTVTFHKSSDTIAPKTLKSMFTQTGWTEDDRNRLKLI